jgi:hypothetical protein
VVRGLKKVSRFDIKKKKNGKRGCAPYSVNSAWVESKPIGKAFHRWDEAEVGEVRDEIRKGRESGGQEQGHNTVHTLPEGSAVVEVVSTMNAFGVWGPRMNNVVYIWSWGSFGRAIPSSGWAAGRVQMKMSAYARICCKARRVGHAARRRRMKSSHLQQV